MRRIANFEINFYQLLNPEGNLNLAEDLGYPLPTWINNYQELFSMYKWMKKTRLFDAKAINLQKIGKLGTYPSILWHEAIGIAIGSSMQEKDIFCPYYRDLGTLLWRGALMEDILSYWGGFPPADPNYKDTINHDFPICVPIATQTLHAAGAAFAVKHQNLGSVVVATIGDGGTSRGDFYEALNLAKVWNLPLVIIIINNQYAISTPKRLQTGSQTLAQKAIAAGVHGEQVDGNDLFGLRSRIEIAIAKARSSNYPSLVEALTYRMSDHTTADDSSRYRSNEEKQNNLASDPLLRVKYFLERKYNFSQQDELQIELECQQEIELAVNNYLSQPEPKFEDMFNYLYKDLPISLKQQKDLD